MKLPCKKCKLKYALERRLIKFNWSYIVQGGSLSTVFWHSKTNLEITLNYVEEIFSMFEVIIIESYTEFCSKPCDSEVLPKFCKLLQR